MNRAILLVDNNAQFRESAAWLLESLGYDVRAFASPGEFLASVDTMANDGTTPCVLLDVRMPGLSGLQVHDALNERRLGWPIVYMTGHGDVPLAVEAMQKGAASFLEKPFQEAALERTLEQAFARAAAAGSARSRPADDAGQDSVDPSRRLEFEQRVARLTSRERQVLDLVIEGKLNKTIADQLGISIKTVELHRSRVMHKMRAGSITELMKIVLRREADPA